MRFLHTADWHLGKLLHGKHLTDDQRGLLRQLCGIVEDTRPDVVLMAGDVYDRSVPPSPAVELLDDTLSELVLELGVPVVAIAGNHDSPDRLDFGSRILRRQGLHVFSKPAAEPGVVTIEDEHGPVHIAGLPYAEPPQARQVFDNPGIKTHDEVVAAQAEAARDVIPNEEERSIAVAHVFAKGGELADSERPLAVGGAETVSASRFDGFDYVALGHLHRRQQVGEDHIQYSGSLMKYSFDEVHHDKSVHLVEMDAEGTCEIRRIPLTPERDLRRVEGTLSEIQAGGGSGDGSGSSPDKNEEDYIWVTLEEEGPVVDAMSRIRETYPNALHVEQQARVDESSLSGLASDLEAQSEEEVFEEFAAHATGNESLSEGHQEVLEEAIGRLEEEERGA
ncbi:exonuclease SbcCD subunit D [Salinibacter altiplanensis]|uniref:exonuclease SbcCD subunit D n=1 Tax=Salinibacter altiplanensis TaxID=1803181 RepID=UPI000C9F8F56|nr:exonuclease SbcCD subunit D [Salinibacter altiplanensis]